MQGRSRTKPGLGLATIFFHIRTTRDKATRRSWQRRARLALAQIDWLTPAERHEICAVWSRPDAVRIDSAAMRKLMGSSAPRSEWETIPARSVMRARFDGAGRRRRRIRNPELCRPGLWHGEPANDQTFSTGNDASRVSPASSVMAGFILPAAAQGFVERHGRL